MSGNKWTVGSGQWKVTRRVPGAACPPVSTLGESRQDQQARADKPPLARVVAWPLSILPLLLLAACLAGCGRGEPVGRVFGTVKFQGQPVTEGIILFRNPAKAVYMTAALQADGSYEVAWRGEKGLPLGTYEAMVNPPLVDAPMGPALEPPKLKPYPNIPEKYRSFTTSGLKLEVKEGENPFDVDMKP